MEKPAYIFGEMMAAFAVVHDCPRCVGVNILGPEDDPIAIVDFDVRTAPSARRACVELARGDHLGLYRQLRDFPSQAELIRRKLGSGYASSGVAAVSSGQSPVSITDLTLSNILDAPIAGFPIVTYLHVASMLLTFWYSHTVAGRALYAVGANEEAARYAGVPVTLVSVLPFVITGAFCAIAGLVSVAYNAAGLATTGNDWPLSAIAGAVIGGVSITGGGGTIVAAFVGMILIGAVQNALVFIDIGTNYQTIVLGVAGWMRYVTGLDEHNRPFEIQDPIAPELRRRTRGFSSAGALADSLIGIRAIVGTDLPHDQVFRKRVDEHLSSLLTQGAAWTVGIAGSLSSSGPGRF